MYIIFSSKKLQASDCKSKTSDLMKLHQSMILWLSVLEANAARKDIEGKKCPQLVKDWATCRPAIRYISVFCVEFVSLFSALYFILGKSSMVMTTALSKDDVTSNYSND